MDINTNISQSRAILQAKIAEKRLQRASRHAKDQILERTMKSMGIEKEKFQKDLEAVTKAGGLTIDAK